MFDKKEYAKKYREEHREQINDYAREYSKTRKPRPGRYNQKHYLANKDEYRASNYKKRYGITLADYNRMFSGQDGKCAICGNEHVEGSAKLAVDHNHMTGKVRGLLCRDCNQAIGHMHDSIELLEKAIIYLKGA